MRRVICDSLRYYDDPLKPIRAFRPSILACEPQFDKECILCGKRVNPVDVRGTSLFCPGCGDKQVEKLRAEKLQLWEADIPVTECAICSRDFRTEHNGQKYCKRCFARAKGCYYLLSRAKKRSAISRLAPLLGQSQVVRPTGSPP